MASGKASGERIGGKDPPTRFPSKISALAGMAGPFVLVLSDLICTYFNPRYNPFIESVSDQVFGPLGWVQTLGFYLFGVFEIAFSQGLGRHMEKRRGFGTAMALLVMIGLGFLIIGTLHTDPPGNRRTLEGTIHIYVAEVIALLFPVACFLLTPSLKRDARWKGFFHYTIITGIIGLSLAVGRMRPMTQWLWLGLHERLLVLNAIVWMELVAIRRLKLRSLNSDFSSSFGSLLWRGKSSK